MNPAIPEPTRDFAHGVRNIAEYGLTLVPDVLTGDRLTATREAFYRAVNYVKAILGWPALLGYKSEGLGLVHGKSPA